MEKLSWNVELFWCRMNIVRHHRRNVFTAQSFLCVVFECDTRASVNVISQQLCLMNTRVRLISKCNFLLLPLGWLSACVLSVFYMDPTYVAGNIPSTELFLYACLYDTIYTCMSVWPLCWYKSRWTSLKVHARVTTQLMNISPIDWQIILRVLQNFSAAKISALNKLSKHLILLAWEAMVKCYEIMHWGSYISFDYAGIHMT